MKYKPDAVIRKVKRGSYVVDFIPYPYIGTIPTSSKKFRTLREAKKYIAEYRIPTIPGDPQEEEI